MNHVMTLLSGIRIMESEAAGRYEYRQLRYPRSKKKRIRRKWAKRWSRRVLVEPLCYKMADPMFGGEVFVMHPVLAAELRQRLS